jgi:Zn-dependent M28 family amino/carboxypeptidase
MRKVISPALCGIAMLGSPVMIVAQDARTRAMEATAITIDSVRLRRDVEFLASDALAGRSTLTAGYDSAAAYVARALKQLGVTPAGDSGGYFQHYTVIASRLDTTRASGSIDGHPLRYGDDFVVQGFLTGGVHAGEVVYVGDGVRAPAAGIDRFGTLDVRGKWLLVHGTTSTAMGNAPGISGLPGVDYFTVNEEARARGALGVLLLPSAPLVAGWQGFRNRELTARDLVPSVGRAYAANPVTRVVLSRDAAARLLAGTALDPTALASVDSTRSYPASFALGRLVSIDLAATTTTYRPYNVVGLVEGSDPDPAVRNQWISVASHLDGAVGRAVTPTGDSIYNAADDNASGSAGNLAVARALMAGPRPRRSILLIWDSGEEIGLWGSRHLAFNASDRIVAHFNVDMIGRTKAPGTTESAENNLAGPMEVFVSGPAVVSSALERVLKQVQSRYRWATLTAKHDDPSVSFFYPRTDAAPFMEVGIPVFQFFTGLHADYHRQTDEVAKLDLAKMEGVSRMVYATVWLVADDAERPRWDKPVPRQLPFVTPRP